MEENIAKIVVDSTSKQILGITFYRRNFRFKCRRCATFCCKLGSPSLAEKDVQRIKETGYVIDNLLERNTERESNSVLKTETRLRKRNDGSCIFLRFNDETKIYECSVYDARPVLCRVYPFDLERIDSNSFMLRFIPCCNGLNSVDGELVNEMFINNYLRDAIFEIL